MTIDRMEENYCLVVPDAPPSDPPPLNPVNGLDDAAVVRDEWGQLPKKKERSLVRFLQKCRFPHYHTSVSF